jgi:predicted ABC-class ATPase
VSDSASELARDLERIDGRSYPAYKDLQRRAYPLGADRLTFEHVQGDPFAAPSRIRIDIPAGVARLPAWATANADARRATADFLHRAILQALAGARHRSGSGKSGLLEIAPLGQEVLERSAVHVEPAGDLRLRLTVGLPAAGRRILGRSARELLAERLPSALDRVFPQPDLAALENHVRCVEDQVVLRDQLTELGLIAFLPEGSVLPRRSGVDMRPMPNAVPLEVPESLRFELEAPHVGKLQGLGIPCGVTLIVGGGYHGKSTLLSVLALGVYDHIPGDGRERCVTVADAVTIRAEDGRSVRGVDLRPFIGQLPLGRNTERFDTDDGSGSTSQAAAIVEALEVGAGVFFVDGLGTRGCESSCRRRRSRSRRISIGFGSSGMSAASRRSWSWAVREIISTWPTPWSRWRITARGMSLHGPARWRSGCRSATLDPGRWARGLPPRLASPSRGVWTRAADGARSACAA